jgi:hypothetical protein
MNSKYSSTSKFIEDDFNYKLEKTIKEKDDEINRLVLKVNDIVELNEKQNLKIEENLRIIQDLRQNYNDKFNEMNTNYSKKDLESIEIKNYYENKLETLTKNYEDEKSRIINNYEENFNK